MQKKYWHKNECRGAQYIKTHADKAVKRALLFWVVIVCLLTPAAAIQLENQTEFEIVYQNNAAMNTRTDSAALAYYLRPSPEIESDDEQIVELAQYITQGIASDYDRAKAIHTWVAENLWYDMDCIAQGRTYAIAAIDVLQTRRCVCTGYANLTVALLRASNIPAKTVGGYAVSNGDWPEFALKYSWRSNHRWVECYAEQRWIMLDPTWDSVNQYQSGVYNPLAKSKGRYFDISLEELSKTHKRLGYYEDIIPQEIDTSEVHFNNELQLEENYDIT